MKKLFQFLFIDLVDIWNEQIYLWIKERRRKQAIKIADKLSKLNNGRKYYVLKHYEFKDRYMVKNKSQLERMKRKGILKADLDFRDYMREAVYVTKLQK